MFAFFELLLALIAHILKIGDALKLSNEPIRSESVITYQKVTVIISDFVYYYAVYRLCRAIESRLVGHAKKTDTSKLADSQGQVLVDSICRPNTTSSVALLLLFQPILFLVDHIHFQYNGLLSGVLLLSICHVIRRNYLRAAFWFTILLNMKHIYLYCAPAYGMYFLTSYCFAKPTDGRPRLSSALYRVSKLGLPVVLVTIFVFAPFADPEVLKQIYQRLFPFKRGLTHAYWAPNVWTLYNIADKALVKILKPSPKAQFNLDSITPLKRDTSTSGLVQEYDHECLPSISPLTTFILVGLFTLPLVVKYSLNVGKSSSGLFLKGLALASFTSFMFGWHVHEKAILLPILPLIPAALLDTNLYNLLTRITLFGTYSILPLIYKQAEYPTKICILIASYQLTKFLAPKQQDKIGASKQQVSRFKWASTKAYHLFDNILPWTILITEFYVTLLHGRLDATNIGAASFLIELGRLEFLPLLLTSLVSAVGITFSYLELYYYFLTAAAIEVDGFA